MKKISEGKVLLIGLGGLGSAAALYLVHSGIGHLGICDHDLVELSNLGRQAAYDLSDLGKAKTTAVEKLLQSKSPHTKVEVFPQKITQQNFATIAREYEIVIEAVDDSKTKIDIHDLAIKNEKVLVHAGVLGIKGQLLTVVPRKSACLRCFFEDLTPLSDSSCAKDGVFAPLVGVLGSLQAGEALKYFLRDLDELQINQLLQIDLFRWQFKVISQQKKCRSCASSHP